jgi:hypothetical protein
MIFQQKPLNIKNIQYDPYTGKNRDKKNYLWRCSSVGISRQILQRSYMFQELKKTILKEWRQVWCKII